MSTRKTRITPAELARPFEGDLGRRFPAVRSPEQLAELLGRSVKTVYHWLALGRLDGTYRKRGKHVLCWRDRVLDLLFCGKDWTP